MVHRPRYGDWSLPKGKLESGESPAEGAVREVAEETGLQGELGEPLPQTRYVDASGRPKVVHWWLLEVDVSDQSWSSAVPNDEVDELRWVGPLQAARLLTNRSDIDLVLLANRQLAPQP